MSCESFRESLLDFGWDGPARRRAAEVVAHLEFCADCRTAADDFDRIKRSLGSSDDGSQPVGGWAAFGQRLESSITPRRTCAWRLPVTALAASLLIGVTAFRLGRTLSTVPTSTVASNPERSRSDGDQPHFLPQRVRHDMKAFHQVSQFYDGRASWMMVSNESSDVGVEAVMLAVPRRVLLLGLTMSRAGKVASSADLLVVPGQTANLTVPLNGGESLHYRIGTSADEPTLLSVWLEVTTPHGGEPLAALSTKLQLEPGQKVTAGQFATSAGEYQLKIAFTREDLPQG